MAEHYEKKSRLYRMMTSEHICPYGIKAKDLLERNGFSVTDIHLKSRDEVETFKTKNNVKTTPQIFIGTQRVGGYNDLVEFLGKQSNDGSSVTYKPVIALFSVAALLALSITWLVLDTFLTEQTIGWFISVSMVLMGLQKLQDIDKFATMFLTYDLLAQRWIRYGYVYPFIETGAGLLMLMGIFTWIAASAALIVASIGALSVIKAVYVDKRVLKCACLGDSRVPLGFVSLIENLMMIGMAVWMLTIKLNA